MLKIEALSSKGMDLLMSMYDMEQMIKGGGVKQLAQMFARQMIQKMLQDNLYGAIEDKKRGDDLVKIISRDSKRWEEVVQNDGV